VNGGVPMYAVVSKSGPLDWMMNNIRPDLSYDLHIHHTYIIIHYT
jgi:hypothetical protein